MRTLKIFSFLIISSLFTSISCNKEKLSELSDVIYVRNNGADMPAYIYGNGVEKVFIIVLHGGPGGNGLEYRYGQYAEDLEEKFAMVYWDQRGQGMAQGNYDDEDVTISQMANDLYCLVLILKHKYGNDIKPFIMGHSWGGTLGSYFMITDDYQELVSGWIEVDGAHDIPKLNIEAVKMFRNIATEQISDRNSVNAWQDILEWANEIDTANISNDMSGEINTKAYEAEELLKESGIVLRSGSKPSISSILFSPNNSITSSISGNFTGNHLNDEIESTSLTDRLQLIQKPCLFLWGKYDFVVPPQLGIDAFNNVNTTDKRIVIFNNSGHSPMDNEPKQFVSEIVNFIETYK